MEPHIACYFIFHVTYSVMMLFLSILLAKLNKLLTELDWTAFLLFCFWFPFLFVRLLFSWNNFILCSNRILYPIFHCAPTTTIILSLYLNLIEEFPIIFSSRNKNRLHSFFSTFFYMTILGNNCCLSSFFMLDVVCI